MSRPVLRAGTPVLDYAAALTGMACAGVDERAAGLLGYGVDEIETDPTYSALNADGDPLQLMLSIAPSKRSIRLIADPASNVSDPYLRRSRAREALANHIAHHAVDAAPFEDLFARAVPWDPAHLADPRVGDSWLASELPTGGCAVYANTSWATPSSMRGQLLSWLDDQAGTASGLDQLLAGPMSEAVRPASAGLEIDPSGLGRAKIYFRLDRSIPIRQMGLAPLDDERIATFLRAVLGATASSSALVFSAGVIIGRAGLFDAKVDVCRCPTCVREDPGWWERSAPVLSQIVDNDLADLADIDTSGVEIAFVGLGLRVDGSARLNIYLTSRSR